MKALPKQSSSRGLAKAANSSSINGQPLNAYYPTNDQLASTAARNTTSLSYGSDRAYKTVLCASKAAEGGTINSTAAPKALASSLTAGADSALSANRSNEPSPWHLPPQRKLRIREGAYRSRNRYNEQATAKANPVKMKSKKLKGKAAEQLWISST